MNKILIGVDPEVFLRNKFTGKFVSAADPRYSFPGTKYDPFPVIDGAIQVDGHALEFNTRPVDNEDEFVYVINNVFRQLNELVTNTDPTLEIAFEPVATFDEDYFKMLPEHSKELGCTPDFSSVDGHELDAPPIGERPIRTSSGHIHIGITEDEDAFDPEVFKQRLDMAQRITPYLLKVARKWETTASNERRKYYGREGSFRPKHYGVELRALDCLWLKSDDTIREVFRTTVNAYNEEFRHAA